MLGCELNLAVSFNGLHSGQHLYRLNYSCHMCVDNQLADTDRQTGTHMHTLPYAFSAMVKHVIEQQYSCILHILKESSTTVIHVIATS